MFDAIIESLLDALNYIFAWLPDSPLAAMLSYIDSGAFTFLKFLNWLIPIGTFISLAETWLTCIGVFYAYQIILRWVRAIGD